MKKPENYKLIKCKTRNKHSNNNYNNNNNFEKDEQNLKYLGRRNIFHIK